MPDLVECLLLVRDHQLVVLDNTFLQEVPHSGSSVEEVDSELELLLGSEVYLVLDDIG
jgi:hypothetical protein